MWNSICDYGYWHFSLITNLFLRILHIGQFMFNSDCQKRDVLRVFQWRYFCCFENLCCNWIIFLNIYKPKQKCILCFIFEFFVKILLDYKRNSYVWHDASHIWNIALVFAQRITCLPFSPSSLDYHLYLHGHSMSRRSAGYLSAKMLVVMIMTSSLPSQSMRARRLPLPA